MKKWVLLGFVLLLAIDTTATVLIKLAGNRIGPFAGLELALPWLRQIVREPLVLAIAGCYLASFLIYTSLLKYAAVGPAYAAAHGQVVTVLIVSMLWFGERLTLVQAAGCALIIAGIVVLGVTETLEAEREKGAEAPAPAAPPAGADHAAVVPAFAGAAAVPAVGSPVKPPFAPAAALAERPPAHPFSRGRGKARRTQRSARPRRGRR